MKKRTFLAIAVIGTAVFLMSRRRRGALLFRVSGNGLRKPSYIFGTHHMADTSMLRRVPGFREAFCGAEAVVGELLLDDMAGMNSEIMRHTSMPEGMSYENMLGADDYALLDRTLREYLGAGVEAFRNVHPAWLSTRLTGAAYSRIAEDCDERQRPSIDEYAQVTGRELGKSVYGLETVGDQIEALFYSEPVEKKAQSLVASLKNTGHMERSLKDLNRYYRRGRLDRLHGMAFDNPGDPSPLSEEYSFALNGGRNEKWAAKLPAMMETESCFVAVGALHLPGKEGILARLRGMGYTVEAVE